MASGDSGRGLMALAYLGYGIYNGKKKQDFTDEVMKDTSRPMSDRMMEAAENNPSVMEQPWFQEMLETSTKMDTLKEAANTRRQKANWEKSVLDLTGDDRKTYFRANADMAAKYNPEEFKIIHEEDINTREQNEWLTQHELTRGEQIADREDTQANARGIAEFTANRSDARAIAKAKAEALTKAPVDMRTVEQKQLDELKQAEAKTRQKNQIAQEAANEQFNFDTEQKANMVQDLIDTRTKAGGVSGAQEKAEYETKRRALITMEALAQSSGAEPNPQVIAQLEDKYPSLSMVNLADGTHGMREELRSINTARKARGFQPLKMQALSADLPDGFKVDQ